MSQSFASSGDLGEKKITFSKMGEHCYGFTAEGDPNTGVIIGDDSVMVIDAQATPLMAQKVIDRVKTITDKPVSHVVLTHYHAVRTLGASAYNADQIIMSDSAYDYVLERGEQDWESEFRRFPRLFQGHESIPGLTYPTTTFSENMTIFLGQLEVRLMKIGRGHTAGDLIVHVPESNVVFSGDLVEYESACYCGDAHLGDWPSTLDKLGVFQSAALLPGRGAALVGRDMVKKGIDMTRDFITTLYGSVQKSVAADKTLKEAFDSANEAMRKKFGSFAIFEHCQPFSVSRAYDEARGIDHPVIWTAERDIDMWNQLNG